MVHIEVSLLLATVSISDFPLINSVTPNKYFYSQVFPLQRCLTELNLKLFLRFFVKIQFLTHWPKWSSQQPKKCSMSQLLTLEYSPLCSLSRWQILNSTNGNCSEFWFGNLGGSGRKGRSLFFSFIAWLNSPVEGALSSLLVHSSSFVPLCLHSVIFLHSLIFVCECAFSLSPLHF